MDIINTLHDFHFLRPWWFLALAPLAYLLWMLMQHRAGEKSWEQVCEKHLIPHVLVGKLTTHNKRFLFLPALIGAIAILALAGPTSERQPQPAVRDQSALVIAFDLSRSMDAVDVDPSRLTRARYKVSDLINRRQSGQTALIGYAADAFTVVPLTDDLQAIEIYLSSLSSDILPKQGSRPDLALEQAASLIKQAGLKYGDILLVTDYVDDKRSIAMAKQLAQSAYRVSVLGMGTESGAPIELKSGSLLSHKGKTVIAHFDSKNLRTLAQAGDGVYQRFDPVGEDDVITLTKLFESAPVSEQDDKEQLFSDAWKEQGPWLVLLLLPLAALGFRRGVLLILVCLALPFARPVQADWWDDLWWRSDQQGVRAFEEGDNEKAAKLLKDPRWKAANAYRSKNFKAARKTLNTPETADDWYNTGNILANEGNLGKAIKSYQKALKLDPNMEDAQFNLGVVRKMIEQQMQQQAQSGEGEEQSEEEQDAQQGEQQNTDGEQSDGSNQEDEGDKNEQQEQQSSASNDEQQTDDESQAKQEEQNGEQDEPSEPDDEAKESPDDPSNDDNPSDETNNEQTAASNNEGETLSEDQQAVEQWLRQIDTDPSQMLKRKFQYQQQKEKKNTEQGDRPW